MSSRRPRHWLRDLAPQIAPRFRPGRFMPRIPHEPQHHEPPTHGLDLRPRHGTRPPLAWRWRRAWLPPASRLDSPRRLPTYTPSRAAPCRVPCGGSSKLKNRPAPSRSVLGAGIQIRARRWPRPVSRLKVKTPLCRLRSGGRPRTSRLVRKSH